MIKISSADPLKAVVWYSLDPLTALLTLCHLAAEANGRHHFAFKWLVTPNNLTVINKHHKVSGATGDVFI